MIERLAILPVKNPRKIPRWAAILGRTPQGLQEHQMGKCGSAEYHARMPPQ